MADNDLDSGADTPPWEDEAGAAPERDPNTSDIFGEPAPATPAEPPPTLVSPPIEAPEGEAYTVLARKYRPRTFEDLIGQEAMVRTLTNAFATGRIAHAFMLTGVRGVGKTTTARLLARALNYETDAVDRPSVDLKEEGRHCRAIIEGRHMDVMELDAASRTKVDEMRELLESVRYGPVEARYKVYVIDEVHMLSTAAFNALLKTLEEPPPHAKFIFATTEIRKVPVTILSRCQRFDLRRVEPETLLLHLEKICAAENALVETEGLALIARAAEGSVRDSLSLLDQALVQADRGQIVKAEVVRDMLGLADRSQTIALFESVMGGRTAEALDQYRTLYGFGADPAQLISDLLEHCHATTIAKTLGPDATRLPNDQAQRMAAMGAAVSAGTLARSWQMLLKAYDEVRRAPDPAAAGEMAVVRLCYAADLPGPEEALKRLQAGEAPAGGPPPGAPSGGGGGGGARAAVQVRPSTAEPEFARPQTFEDVVALIGQRRDIGLKLDVERFVRLVSFKPGMIEYEPGPNAPGDLPRRLSARLKEWTGQTWLIAAQGGGGAESLYERERREKGEERARIEADPFVLEVQRVFPGAQLIDVRSLADQTLVEPDAGAVGEAEGGGHGEE
ncbi:MAG: DNA polymerase III subunit gamma/tau [Caulobacteraceae bacterium]|nr:DNA polymerase III subunit gamma/tau [Caulobacteraceae bacterium]